MVGDDERGSGVVRRARLQACESPMAARQAGGDFALVHPVLRDGGGQRPCLGRAGLHVSWMESF